MLAELPTSNGKTLALEDLHKCPAAAKNVSSWSCLPSFVLSSCTASEGCIKSLVERPARLTAPSVQATHMLQRGVCTGAKGSLWTCLQNSPAFCSALCNDSSLSFAAGRYSTTSCVHNTSVCGVCSSSMSRLHWHCMADCHTDSEITGQTCQCRPRGESALKRKRNEAYLFCPTAWYIQ